MSDNNILIAAREFNTIENCGINPQRAHELIEDLVGEVERLRKQQKAHAEMVDDYYGSR